MRWLCILMVSLLATKSLAQELLFTSLPSKNRHLLFLIQGGQVEPHDIHVQGWYCRYNGEAGLFLTRSDCLAGNVDNAIRVELSAGRTRQLDAWSQPRFIEVSGDFHSWREHRPEQSAFIWGKLVANGRHFSDSTPLPYRTIAEQETRAEQLRQSEERENLWWKLMDRFYDQDDQCISPIKELCDFNVSLERRLQKLKEVCLAGPDDPAIKELCELLPR